MGKPDLDSTSVPQPEGRFPPTHWTLVMSAGKDSSPDARDAFGRLYRAYLSPLLAFLRREGHGDDEARELVQGFFEFQLETRGFGKVRPEGKFRCWLLASLKHYRSDVWDKARAAKRGGGQPHVTLDSDEETVGVKPPDPGRTPDEEYEHLFALRFLELVMDKLGAEYQAKGKGQVFECLHALLLDKKGAARHADLGRELGMTETAVTTEIFRMRKRYRDIFDEELEQLVGSRDELEAEKRFLFASLSK